MSRNTETRRSIRLAVRRLLVALVALVFGLLASVSTALPASADTAFTGTVRDQAGQPVLGIPIQIWTTGGTFIETINSDSSDGTYESSSLPAGGYYYAIVDGSVDGTGDHYGLSTANLDFDDSVLDITVARYVDVSGTIANWSPAVGDVYVTLWENQGSSWISGVSAVSTDGTFGFSSTINTNPYTLSFDVSVTNAPLLSAYLRGEDDPVVFDFPDYAMTIPGSAGTPLTGIETYLPAASTITGTVTTDNGATPLAGIEVWLENGAGSFATQTVTDVDGTYTLYARPGGAYLIVAEDPGGFYGSIAYDGWEGCGCSIAFTPVYAPDSGIDFELTDASMPPSTLQILGGVADLDSDFLNDIDVRLFRASGATWVLAKTMTSYDFGYYLANFGFVIDHLPTAYRVQFVDADGDILKVYDGATTPDLITITPLDPLPACYANLGTVSVDTLMFALVDPDTATGACAALDAPAAPGGSGGSGSTTKPHRTSTGTVATPTPTPTPSATPTSSATPQPSTDPTPSATPVATDEPPASAPDLWWLLWVLLGVVVIVVVGGVVYFVRRV
jgi:hypothetical protein